MATIGKMIIPPKYTLTREITQLLSEIEASRAVIDAVEIQPEIETNIRRRTTLSSSLFSARVEGNNLTMEELTPGSKLQKKAEVFNILKALEWLRGREKKDLTLTDVLLLHKITMKGIHEDAGKWRTESSATFNSAGIAIYMHPPARQAQKFFMKLLKFINSEKEPLIPVRAALAHYSLEKIHPFLDGNGRTGRLIFQKVLMQGGYGMKGLVALEEYLDNHRSEYYRALEEPEKEVTDYIIFMLQALSEASKKAVKLVLASKENFSPEDVLLPRRSEIVKIVKDQRMITVDMLVRRFLSVNPRTLRNDVKRLVDAGFLAKLGTTRGVYYVLGKK